MKNQINYERKKKVIQDRNRECLECKKIFLGRSTKKFCTKNCLNKGRKKRLNLVDYGVNRNTVGAMSELLVSVDLLKKGFSVFRSISPNADCDLIALKGNKFLRIEVTTGHTLASGKVIHAGKDKSLFDYLAVVIHPFTIIYTPSLEDENNIC